MQKTIQQLIDEALLPQERERSGKFNPSSFGNCFRAQIWNRRNEPKSNPPDARALRVFKAGQLFHDFVQGLICSDRASDMERIAIKEMPIEESDVKGFADLVTETEVIDIKSQHSRSFWWMAKKDMDIRKEKYGNWLQVMYYAIALEKPFARLVFVSKDDLCINEYVQPVDSYWKAEVQAELSMLRQWWLVEEMPFALPRCEPKTDKKTKAVTYWQCTYCSWFDKCKQVEKEAGRQHPCTEIETQQETELVA